jgi:hypothetical protein
MPLFFSPVCSPTCLLQLHSFFNYLEFLWGVVPPLLSCGACYALATFTSLPLSKHTGGEVLTLLPCPACLFTDRVGIVPPPLSRAQGTLPSLLNVFFFSFSSYLFISQIGFFLFFPWVGISLSSGLCWFTVCHLPHLVVCVFPSSLRAGVWWCRSPLCFSI